MPETEVRIDNGQRRTHIDPAPGPCSRAARGLIVRRPTDEVSSSLSLIRRQNRTRVKMTYTRELYSAFLL
jgi:hypothetical protein